MPVQTDGIPTEGIVSIVLGAIGLLLAATVIGLIATPLFFVPAIILGYSANTKYKTATGKSSTLLIVFLTLEWVAGIIGLLAIGLIVWQSQV